jgi:hypothetical protein
VEVRRRRRSCGDVRIAAWGARVLCARPGADRRNARAGGGGNGGGDEEIIIPLGTETVIPMGFGGGGGGGFSIPLNMDPSMFQGPQVCAPLSVLPPRRDAGAATALERLWRAGQNCFRAREFPARLKPNTP